MRILTATLVLPATNQNAAQELYVHEITDAAHSTGFEISGNLSSGSDRFDTLEQALAQIASHAAVILAGGDF